MAFPANSVIDDFNRADETLGGNWTTPLVRLDYLAHVISNVANNTQGWASAYRNNANFGPDCEVFAKMAGTANEMRLFWRINSPASTSMSGYVAKFLASTDHVVVYEITNNTWTQLDDQAVGSIGVGDVLGIQHVGNTIQIFKGTAQIGTNIDASAATNNHTGSGRIGFEQFGNGHPLDDFGGGDLTISVPANTVAPVITGTVVVGTALSCGTGTWTNSPTSYSYQWQVETAVGSGTYGNISAATTNSYTPVTGDIGKKLRTQVTATNAAGSASAYTAATSPVSAASGSSTSFPSTVVRDDAARSNENPLSNSGNWTSHIYSGDFNLQLLTNEIISSGAGWGSMYWNTNFGPDCEVWGQMDPVGDTGWEYWLFLGIANPNGSSLTGYAIRAVKYVGIDVWRIDAAVPTQILYIPLNSGWQANSQFGLRRIGSTLFAYRDGTLLGQIDDATYTGAAKTGLRIYGTLSGFTQFGAGTYTGPIAPPFTPRIFWLRQHAPAVVSNFTVSSNLSGTLTVPVTWQATPSIPVNSVDFLIDGTQMWTENISPYVYNGDPGGQLDPSTLPNGTHTFTVVATAPDGSTATTSQTLTVNSTLPPNPPPSGTTPGRVNFWMYATSQADYLVTGGRPTAADKTFMLNKWQRVECWVTQYPAFHPGAMRYDDSIAIYTGSAWETQHPDWILKDTAGNPLKFYSNVQWLADPGNTAYQAAKAAEVAAFINQGYHGVKLDDVNQDKVTNASAVNPRTGQVYTLPQWQKDIADLITKIRQVCKAQDPNFQIACNSLWWANGPDVDRCIGQMDLFQLERGFNDTNYNASSIQQVWAFVDKLHSKGVGAIHLSEASGSQAVRFNLACALLCSDGRDYAYGEGWRPESYDAIWDTNLGAATNSRHVVSGNLWRRDFQLGYATADLVTKVGTIVKL